MLSYNSPSVRPSPRPIRAAPLTAPLAAPPHRAPHRAPQRPPHRPPSRRAPLPRCHRNRGRAARLTHTRPATERAAGVRRVPRIPLHITPPPSRAALLAPLYGVYNLQLEMDEAVLLFPCGLLAFYFLSKVCLGKCFGYLWSGTTRRLSASFGSAKAGRVAPAKARNGGAPDSDGADGLAGFDGLSAEEDSIRQVAAGPPPRPSPPSRIHAPTRVAHPGDALPRYAPRCPAPPLHGSKRPTRA